MTEKFLFFRFLIGRSGEQKGNTFPVVVFVHGGNFDSGSGNLFGPQALVDQNLVVVTLNYRLGMLGFASTEDDALPGNLGLRDQLLALQWVRDNIGKKQYTSMNK